MKNENGDRAFRIECTKAMLKSMLDELKDGNAITEQMVSKCLKTLTGELKVIPSLKECGFKKVHKYGFII